MARASSGSVATSTRSRNSPRLSWDDVRELGLQLPNVEHSIAWGTNVLRLNGNIFAARPIHRSAEPGSVSIHCDPSVRDAMIEEQPDVYYTAQHYENYPVVLVRLSRITRDVLDDLLRMGHRYVASKPPNRRAKSPRKRKTKSRRSRTS
jgi:hypothetical protein